MLETAAVVAPALGDAATVGTAVLDGSQYVPHAHVASLVLVPGGLVRTDGATVFTTLVLMTGITAAIPYAASALAQLKWRIVDHRKGSTPHFALDMFVAIVALVMSVIDTQRTSRTVTGERSRGAMALMVSTPVTRLELMIGKLAPYFAIGLVDAAICVLVAIGWFGVPFRGALLTLLGTTCLFLAVVLAIGYLVSVSIRSQVGASQVALVLTMLPTTLLSGFTFPIDQMPPVVQGVTTLVSARYYVTILKAIFLKGSSALELAWPIACLALYAVVVVALAARAFRKTLD